MKTFRLPITLLTWATLLAGPVGLRADLAAIFTNAAAAGKPANPPRTSIIFIQCHDLGYADLSCYGQTNYQTPNLDRLAAEGLRFTDYHARTEEKFSSTATLLAGKNTATLATNDQTLAHQLLNLGYHTGLIGEWAVDSQPWTCGFEEFAGFLDDREGLSYYPHSLWRYRPNTKSNPNHDRVEPQVIKEGLYDDQANTGTKYWPDLQFTVAANYIRIHKPEKFSHYRPFFLLLNLSAPRSATFGADDFPVPTDAPFTSEAWPQAAKNRAALITRIDAGVGRLLEQLGKFGLTNNVAVFFTSTGGPETFANTNLMKLIQPNGVGVSGQPGDRWRVPMIVHWPATVAAQRTSDAHWSAVDFAPTALQISEAKLPSALAGVSILPTLVSPPPIKHVKVARQPGTTNAPGQSSSQ
jgi:arylsulfatase A-like enzyme